MENEKVSIIMPAYNCERFIAEAIQSVQAQTYANWELIIVDDCSTDQTRTIIEKFALEDKRIIFLKNEINSGAAASRNKAVEAASGRYMAFLDGDDVWMPEKLERQLAFMISNNYVFTCTDYLKIDEQSNELDEIVPALNADYRAMLKRCPGNSTVVYDSEILGKFTVPVMRNREDYVMWLDVIKKAEMLHGLHEILGCHRIGMQSLSSNKFKLVKYHWVIYRNIEGISLIKSLYYTSYWIFRGVFHIR